MTWQCGQRLVAEPTAATLSGTSMAGGALIHVDVAFRLVEWPWKEKGPLTLIPQPSEVTARVSRGELHLGFALPNPADAVSPSSHSAPPNLPFTPSLATAALVARKAAR